MVAQQERMESITANLANSTTIGFKRRLTTTHGDLVGRQGSEQVGLVVKGANDFSQGTMQRTAQELDLAFEGPGFFAVEGPDGEIYTRDGEFHLNGEGVLITPEGYPVAWEGAAGVFEATGRSILVDPQGVLSQAGAQIGKLKVVEFAEPSRLRHTDNGYWTADAEMEREEPTGLIRQGYLEASNVNAVHELVAMITVQRSFEQASQAMTQIDQSYRRLHRPQ